ncbi:MAG: hypothetical protein ACRDJW_20295 [Thermomicrobiales bacterium]
MDGPRFPTAVRSLAVPITRRRALRGLAGGLAAALAGSHLAPSSTVAAISPAARTISPVGLGNPAARVLLPGDAGLTDFGIDFRLTGPPAVFFAAGDTPGWSSSLQASVSGFAFGYAATLAKPKHASRAAGRAVQVCLHHGFPSSDDANVAWFSLTTALGTGGDAVNEGATIRSLDVIEVFSVSGRHAILASVDADQFAAVVLTSRSKSDLVTVAIADFTGKTPTIDEALALAEVEAEKLERLVDAGRWDLASAFHAQWTPGFTFGSGAPFFSWPVIRDGQPIPTADDTVDTLALRRQLASSVRFQSHIEGPFVESAPAVAGHGLYYSGQTNFFNSSGDAKRYHEETSARLRAGLPGITLKKPLAARNQRIYPYETPSELGKLGGLMLHRIVADGDFPTSLALHVVTVPFGGGPSFTLSDLTDRLESLLQTMGNGLEECLLAPHRAPVVISVNPPA